MICFVCYARIPGTADEEQAQDWLAYIADCSLQKALADHRLAAILAAEIPPVLKVATIRLYAAAQRTEVAP